MPRRGRISFRCSSASLSASAICFGQARASRLPRRQRRRQGFCGDESDSARGEVEVRSSALAAAERSDYSPRPCGRPRPTSCHRPPSSSGSATMGRLRRHSLLCPQTRPGWPRSSSARPRSLENVFPFGTRVEMKTQVRVHPPGPFIDRKSHIRIDEVQSEQRLFESVRMPHLPFLRNKRTGPSLGKILLDVGGGRLTGRLGGPHRHGPFQQGACKDDRGNRGRNPHGADFSRAAGRPGVSERVPTLLLLSD